MKVAVIDYNAGNVCSVDNALRRLGVEPVLTDSPEEILRADRVIFPGVGEASTTMEYLRARHMDSLIRSLSQPVLGICLGMQLLCRHSQEGDTDCLGLIDAPVVRFMPSRRELKVPHMGWNDLSGCSDKVIDAAFDGGFMYFVHTYYVPLCPETVAVCDYDGPFSAALRKDNFLACQFHPEKSGKVGERLLRRFLEEG